ncbi:hypothetical protein LPJ53_001860 [Coemansia erecta]|uniref:LIM zinc-binding domain-containing protein n=1 Tax=Coemansia erecta TaxID=147472 RepID=A0A9W8CSF1_9FUNG|nr:hypothetical protein LPJ53_001860 [Coemansia erecta]
MKCAQCNQDVHIRLIGQHECMKQPPVPAVPTLPPMKDRGLSSFFGRSKAGPPQPPALPPQQQNSMNNRKNVESRAFPDAYKPSLQLLAEDGAVDDFDFDNILQSAAKGRAPSSNGSYGQLSPADTQQSQQKQHNLYHNHQQQSPGASMYKSINSSNISLDSFGGGISPNGMMPSPGAGVHQGGWAGSKPAGARLEQAREELLSSKSAPSTQSAQPMGAKRMPSEVNVGRGNAASLQNDLMQKLTQPDDDFEVITNDPRALSPNGKPQPAWVDSPPPSSVESEFAFSEQASPSGLSLSPSTPVATGAPAYGRNNSVGRVHNQPHGGNNGHRKTSSVANNDEGRGGGLSIGSMMRSQSNRGDGKSPPVSPQGGSMQQHQHQRQPSTAKSAAISPASESVAASAKAAAISVDTQICISSRKVAAVARSASASASPTPTHVHGFGGTDANGQPERKLSRNATAPSSMSGAARAGAGASSGPSSMPNALDVLASIMGSGGNGKPSVPSINTQVGGGNSRSVSQGLGLSPSSGHSTVGSRVGSQQRAGASAGVGNGGGTIGRGLKSAKLDSLLDDLMGEMQALSADSDRDSVVSSSNSASGHTAAASPVDAGRRGRFDSTVSTASTSSTLSAGGGAHKRVHCSTCGTAISSARGAIVPSGRLAQSTGALGVEHQGRVYCVRDFKQLQLQQQPQQGSTSCASCGLACEASKEVSVHALDAWWHRACFNCQECHRAFPDKSFYVFEQRPYCRYDYHKLNNSLCGACAHPIEGPCAQVYEGRFHPECFACSHCAVPLRDVYYSLDGRFLCEQHVHQHKSHRNANKRQTVFGHI